MVNSIEINGRDLTDTPIEFGGTEQRLAARIVLTDRDLKVTMRGRLLVRAIAMHFDRYLREAQQKAQYSRVI